MKQNTVVVRRCGSVADARIPDPGLRGLSLSSAVDTFLARFELLRARQNLRYAIDVSGAIWVTHWHGRPREQTTRGEGLLEVIATLLDPLVASNMLLTFLLHLPAHSILFHWTDASPTLKVQCPWVKPGHATNQVGLGYIPLRQAKDETKVLMYHCILEANIASKKTNINLGHKTVK
ncbi:hypothetical protein ElyMa_002407500 [Elysia marginata]|uniref:Uncharacterized protein n=1 Tax=Elysia marginata TaxID=1093978 RepID=A0AAV4GFY9_9GAST|nr:hypothetical protein ElyMa_002407500 [Elysia marginata]